MAENNKGDKANATVGRLALSLTSKCVLLPLCWVLCCTRGWKGTSLAVEVQVRHHNPRPANKSKNTIRRISAIFRFDMLVCNISRVNNTQREHFVRGDGLHRRNKIDNNGACEGTTSSPVNWKPTFTYRQLPRNHHVNSTIYVICNESLSM